MTREHYLYINVRYLVYRLTYHEFNNIMSEFGTNRQNQLSKDH